MLSYKKRKTLKKGKKEDQILQIDLENQENDKNEEKDEKQEEKQDNNILRSVESIQKINSQQLIKQILSKIVNNIKQSNFINQKLNDQQKLDLIQKFGNDQRQEQKLNNCRKYKNQSKDKKIMQAKRKNKGKKSTKMQQQQKKIPMQKKDEIKNSIKTELESETQIENQQYKPEINDTLIIFTKNPNQILKQKRKNFKRTRETNQQNDQLETPEMLNKHQKQPDQSLCKNKSNQDSFLDQISRKQKFLQGQICNKIKHQNEIINNWVIKMTRKQENKNILLKDITDQIKQEEQQIQIQNILNQKKNFHMIENKNNNLQEEGVQININQTYVREYNEQKKFERETYE